LAAALQGALKAEGLAAEIVPMDGFHLANHVLDPLGLRSRKGAPETFDAAGFLAMISRLRSEAEVYYPVYDRSQDQAIAGAGVVPPSCDLVIVEGNYLLFDEDPWRRLAALWDVSIWIDTPEDLVRARCVQRWLDHGHTQEAAIVRAEGNDVRNARRIIEKRLEADIVVADTAASNG
jgi:fructokinase